MKQDKVLVKIVPDIRRIKTGSKFPLKLRVTHKGERKYYATGLDVSDEQWAIINSAEVRGKFQKMRIEMAEIERRALECVSEIVPFSFMTFEREFFREVPAEKSNCRVYPNNIISSSLSHRLSQGRVGRSAAGDKNDEILLFQIFVYL